MIQAVGNVTLAISAIPPLFDVIYFSGQCPCLIVDMGFKLIFVYKSRL